MLGGGGKVQTTLTLIILAVMLLGFLGVIPPDYFVITFVGLIVAVVGYMAASFLYPFVTVAGKPMLAISFYKSSSESEWAFGKVAETEGGIIFKECPGGSKSLLCAEIEDVPFIGTKVPYRLFVLKFPEAVDPSTLFDDDYVEPESGFGKIPVRIAYLSGVQIGEMVLSQKTAFKSFSERFMEKLGKKVERVERVPIILVTRYKLQKLKVLRELVKRLKRRRGEEGESGEVRAPVILVTGFKSRDMKLLSSVVKELKSISGYQEVKGSAKAWVTELGQVKIISTELEELRAETMKLRQVIRGLERVYHEEPTILTTGVVIEEEESTKDKVIKYAGYGLGIAALVFLLLLILGVIQWG